AGVHSCYELSLLRGIVVPIVGSGQQMILSDIPCEVGQVFVRFAGDKEAAIGKKIHARFPRRLPELGVIASQFVDEKRDPACRSLDETKPQARKHFGNLIQDKIAESV